MELCFSDEMSDDEQIKRFDSPQNITSVDNTQTAGTSNSVKTYFATCFEDDSGSDAAECSSSHEL